MRILIFHYGKITGYPPVISLVQNLINNKHMVTVISENLGALPSSITGSNCFKGIEFTPQPYGFSTVGLIANVLVRRRKIKRIVKQEMENNDIIWTTTDLSARELGKILFKYKHIMQLMELIKDAPIVASQKKVMAHLDRIARRAYKVIVPELNRAYIQRTWWDLPETPTVLPNKPYVIPKMEETKIDNAVLDKLRNEKRKIILYQGCFEADRNLEAFAEAVKIIGTEKYAFYIMGNESPIRQQLSRTYPFIEYLGYITPPAHLVVAQYAYLGLLPYIPQKDNYYLSELNALYCAPNKIYEYAMCGLPMIGTDVLGLRYPFEKYDIGVCCRHLEAKDIVGASRYVEMNHDRMSSNCKSFFDSVDLDRIVEDIIT